VLPPFPREFFDLQGFAFFNVHSHPLFGYALSDRSLGENPLERAKVPLLSERWSLFDLDDVEAYAARILQSTRDYELLGLEPPARAT
jgi:hypothetical protein